MDRQKALAMLREILELTKEIDVNSISLNPDKSGGFALRIKCVVEESVKNSIKPILLRNNLTMKQEDEFFIIYSAEH